MVRIPMTRRFGTFAAAGVVALGLGLAGCGEECNCEELVTDTGTNGDSGTDTSSTVDTGEEDDTDDELFEFTEEFDGPGLDGWSVPDRDVGAGKADADHASISEGLLLLDTSWGGEDPEHNNQEIWYAGNVESVDSFKYGTFSTRLRAPADSSTICRFSLSDRVDISGDGQHPDTYVLNAISFEIYDEELVIRSYKQWRPDDGEAGGPTHEAFRMTPFEFDFSDWHTFEVVWTEMKASLFVDGTHMVDIVDTAPEVMLHADFAHFSYNDEWNGGTPSKEDRPTCEVDYFRGEGIFRLR